MTDPASLQNLKDIIEPMAVSFWPLAPGAWLLAVFVLLWALVGAVMMRSRWQQNAYRRVGLRELKKIRRHLSMPEGKKAALAGLSILLKRVALTAFPRETVAALSGDRWIAFLDASMDGDRFASRTGKLLADVSYRPSAFAAEISDRQIDELFYLAEQWIRRHRPTPPIGAEPLRSG